MQANRVTARGRAAGILLVSFSVVTMGNEMLRGPGPQKRGAMMIDADIFTCASLDCADMQCVVERTDDPDGLWRVTSDPLGLEYLIALPEPLCPRCGEPMRSACMAHRALGK